MCSPASAHIVGIVYSTSLPVPLLINKGNIENDIVIFCGRGGTRTKQLVNFVYVLSLRQSRNSKIKCCISDSQKNRKWNFVFY